MFAAAGQPLLEGLPHLSWLGVAPTTSVSVQDVSDAREAGQLILGLAPRFEQGAERPTREGNDDG